MKNTKRTIIYFFFQHIATWNIKKRRLPLDPTLLSFSPLTVLTSDYDTTTTPVFLSVSAYVDSSYMQGSALRFKLPMPITIAIPIGKLADQKLVKYDVSNESSFTFTQLATTVIR